MTRRQIIRKSTERYEHDSFCCMQQYTSGTHSHIPAHRSKCACIEGRPNSGTTKFRGEYNWISRKTNDKYSRYHHIQNTYKFRNFHTRRKILWMGYQKLLSRNTHGMVVIYEDTYHIHYTIYCCTLQLKGLSQSRWMDLHGNYTRNVWTTKSVNSCK